MAAGIFRQYDIRGVVGDDLTSEAAEGIGQAYAALLDERGIEGPVAVGRDNRPSGTALREALVQGLTSRGRDVIDIGVGPTPLLYWSLHHLPVAGGIQITGSHNPPEFNGFKLCVGTGSLHGGGIQRLRELLDAPPTAHVGSVRAENLNAAYADDIVERTGPLPRRLKVVLDAGNGAGGPLTEAIFARMNLDATYLFCESDGTFPNHHPDPTVEENLLDLIGAVQQQGADIGIAFDGDADRIGIVDANGTIIWGDYLLLLYARDVFARTGGGQAIIFDVKCSQALPDAITKAGGVPVMWKTGHSLIKDKMKELHAPVAGEMSGHMFFTEGFYGHDDALYAAARILRIVSSSAGSVRDLLADVPSYFSTPELRIDCGDERKFELVEAATAHFRKTHDVIDVDGARVLFGDGWGLIRASNTQPIVVCRFEALTAERRDEIRAEFYAWMRTQGVTV
ncbi:MAG: phosphomannomutase/phosphoglucomutase [Gemmatimonadaceae bacterium]|nr:phosphomannomutase/phosphoglucomutase [Gemmatimonadaceae bacterium]